MAQHSSGTTSEGQGCGWNPTGCPMASLRYDGPGGDESTRTEARRTRLLVADECHRYGAEQFSRALRPPHYEWRLGLTATLERGDSGDKVLASYFGSTVYEVGYGEALAGGELIAPFRFAHVSVPLTPPEERAQYDELSEGLRKDRDTLVVRYGIPLDPPIGEFLQAVSTMADDRTASSGGGGWLEDTWRASRDVRSSWPRRE